MTDDDDRQLRLIYIGGYAHGALLAVRQLLAQGQPRTASEVIGDRLEHINWILFGETPPDADTSGRDEG